MKGHGRQAPTCRRKAHLTSLRVLLTTAESLEKTVVDALGDGALGWRSILLGDAVLGRLGAAVA